MNGYIRIQNSLSGTVVSSDDAEHEHINERIDELEDKLYNDVDTQRLWTAHHPMIDAADSSGNIPAAIAIGRDFATGEKITPSIVAVSRIEEDDGGDNGGTNTAFANIYSYLEQTGNNSTKYPKAIAGVTVNASGGDNDSSGVVGYSCKLDVPANGEQLAGIGDTVGTGGTAWQYSQQRGLVMGGEFAVHQNVSGTTASKIATANNQSIGLHVTTNSTGSPVWSGLSIDAQKTVTGGRTGYGYWNAITIMRSCFAQQNVDYVPGTVGISMANCRSQYPDKAIYFGNATYHLYRDNFRAIRARCSSFDIASGDQHSAGLRLVAQSGSETYHCYKNGSTKYYTLPDPSTASEIYTYNGTNMTKSALTIAEVGEDDEYITISGTVYSRYAADDVSVNVSAADSTYVGFYDGQVGSDGSTSLTTRAMIVNDTSDGNNQLFFRIYGSSLDDYVGLSISKGSNSLRPVCNGQMSLGYSTYRWANVYTNDVHTNEVTIAGTPIKDMLGISSTPVKIQVFGDSLSDDVANQYAWTKYLQDYIPQRTVSLESCANYGSGIGSASHSSGKMHNAGYAKDNVWDLVNAKRIVNGAETENDLLEADNNFVVVLIGTNNFTVGTVSNLGQLGDLLRVNPENTSALLGDTFYGAARAIIERVSAQCPNAVLIICTPPGRYKSGAGDVITNGETTNANGLTLRQYGNALIDCCQHYGVPYVDLFTELNWNPTNVGTYTSDGVHPNALGARRIAKLIANKIKQYL